MILRSWGANPDVTLVPADFREIKAPVALLWGSSDPYGSNEPGRAGAPHFATAKFHAVGVGHLP